MTALRVRSAAAFALLGAALTTSVATSVSPLAAQGAALRSASQCPPATHDRAALVALKASGFAVALIGCLADSDPGIRDGVAFEALQTWMRAKLLSPATVVTLRDRLVPILTDPEGDGFARPFAALVLADVARTDRIDPWMTPAERSALVNAAADYVKGVRDYRGFDDREGWRHGVAHGADLLMQLAYNPALVRADLDRILDAVASQVAPPGHFYRYGEAERLAAPVAAIARRGILTQAEWDAWFAAIAAPAPLAQWSDAYRTQDGLAKRHDTMAFLSFLYLNAKLGGAPHWAPLLPGIEAGVRALP
jgi:hypothetical protein